MWLSIGCLSTTLLIGIGAAGGHKKEWSQERKDIFTKAQLYHFMCNVGIIAGSLVTPQATISPYLFTLGIVFFSGTLFHRVWTDSKEFSKFAPFGGISMMIGWALLAFKK
ncbi:hypothetical protein PPERSA_01747 [Pseudocohnilembus persalinus]|uniref:Uncharacterized protein n=1 Tax=Pseudocohnilembus persalinus TaxID=266149 RepID=A0A0V0R177_PSEPJ|nr:hypothetical protein PPERSA_01747 [Pseudocohnilembus persalinus]|eukprot:KRX08286.1 hypothetical protein PPERSA_01747 [Pseudocohnilembus persalinus]